MVGGEGVGERRKCGREGFEDIKMRNKEEDDREGRSKDRGGEGRMKKGEEGGMEREDENSKVGKI